MLAVLLVASVLAVLGAAALSLAMGNVQRVAARRGIDRAYYAAESASLLFAERAALMAAGGVSPDSIADAATDYSVAHFIAPYMSAASYAAHGEKRGDGYVVRTRAAVAQADCTVVMVLDGAGRVVSVVME